MRLRGKAARPADQGSGNTGDGGWPPVPEDGAANRDGRSLRELASAENQGAPGVAASLCGGLAWS